MAAIRRFETHEFRPEREQAPVFGPTSALIVPAFAGSIDLS